MKSKFLVLYGVSQQGFSLGGKDSPVALLWMVSCPFPKLVGLGEAQVSKRGQEGFVQCLNKEIVWLQRALEAEAALKSG